MALGQEPARARRQVLGEAGRVVAVAVLVGTVAAAGLGRVASGVLYAVEPLDLTSHLVGAGLVVVVAMSACWIPAQRATRVDPMTALREE
jgi:ABC-type antimicrobial peptide transport system permease subunit